MLNKDEEEVGGVVNSSEATPVVVVVDDDVIIIRVLFELLFWTYSLNKTSHFTSSSSLVIDGYEIAEDD